MNAWCLTVMNYFSPIKTKTELCVWTVVGGVTRTTPLELESDFTFELFMCVALLQECRDQLFECTDAAMVFTVINKSVLYTLFCAVY